MNPNHRAGPCKGLPPCDMRAVEDQMSIYVEIRAAEGGDDAKKLVTDQFGIYARMVTHRGL